MILLLKEEDRNNDSNATLPDAKRMGDRGTRGCPDRISDNQEFHLVSKELPEGAGRFELFCKHIHFHSYSH
jgi:hypothetical protein